MHLPQVAFAGRSNVGKSSLLNALFGRKLAAVSKTPGKTRTLNYYLVNQQLLFVDLPGYGYAQVPRGERQSWGREITSYLLEERRLGLVVGLVDPRIPTSPLDMELVRFIGEAGHPLLVVATKADQLSRGGAAAAAQRIAKDLGLEEPPLLFSALKRTGKRELLAAIQERTTAGSVAG
jgi:GTP-binding protein